LVNFQKALKFFPLVTPRHVTTRWKALSFTISMRTSDGHHLNNFVESNHFKHWCLLNIKADSFMGGCPP
jgi:hypothetical protein